MKNAFKAGESRGHRLIRIGRMLTTCDLAPLAYAAWMRFSDLEISLPGYVSPKTGNPPHPSGGPILAKVIRSLAVPKGSIALDVGVGLGLAAITLSRYFESVVGIDHSPQLISAAKRNIAKMRIRNVELHCADARTFVDGLDEITHVYMFNPFPEAIMRIFMENLRKSLMRVPRRLSIIYLNPTCHQTVLDGGFVYRRDFKFNYSHRFAIYESVSGADKKAGFSRT